MSQKYAWLALKNPASLFWAHFFLLFFVILSPSYAVTHGNGNVVGSHFLAASQAARVPIPAVSAALEVRAADPAKGMGKKGVVFVDTSVADHKILEAGIRDGLGIVEIGGSQDGLAQMARWVPTTSLRSTTARSPPLPTDFSSGTVS